MRQAGKQRSQDTAVKPSKGLKRGSELQDEAAIDGRDSKRARVEDSPPPNSQTNQTAWLFDGEDHTEVVSLTPPPKPSEVSESALAIRNAWVAKEGRLGLSAQVFDKQPDLNAQLRVELVEAILAACSVLQLSFQVAHLAIQTLDRMLTKFRVRRDQAKVLVMTVVFIAAKIELGAAPRIQELQQVLCPTVLHSQVIHMEGVVLNTLEFDMNQATALQHTKWWLHTLGLTNSPAFVRLFRTLSTISLTSVELLDYPPSKIGTAICAAAYDIFSFKRPETLAFIDKPCESCVRCIVNLHASQMASASN